MVTWDWFSDDKPVNGGRLDTGCSFQDCVHPVAGVGYFSGQAPVGAECALGWLPGVTPLLQERAQTLESVPVPWSVLCMCRSLHPYWPWTIRFF